MTRINPKIAAGTGNEGALGAGSGGDTRADHETGAKVTDATIADLGVLAVDGNHLHVRMADRDARNQSIAELEFHELAEHGGHPDIVEQVDQFIRVFAPELEQDFIKKLDLAKFLIEELGKSKRKRYIKAVNFLTNLLVLKKISAKQNKEIGGLVDLLMAPTPKDIRTKEGIYFEAQAAIALANNGFIINSVSTRHYNDQQIFDNAGTEREIDMEIKDGAGQTYFVETKLTLESFYKDDRTTLDNHLKTQFDFLVQFAKDKATPVLVVGKYQPIFDESGNVKNYKEHTVDQKKVALLKQQYPPLEIWYEDGTPVLAS